MNETFDELRVKRIGGSPEKALSNSFTLDPNVILQEAWELTKVTKGPFLVGAIIIYFITLLGTIIFNPLQGDLTIIEDISEVPWGFIVSQLAMQIVAAVLLAGLINMGLRNAVRYVRSSENELTVVPENKPTMVFEHLLRAWPIVAVELIKLLGLVVIMYLGFLIGSLFQISLRTFFGFWLIVGVTFTIGLSLAIPLVIKDQLNPLKAVRVSLRVISRQFFAFATIYMVMSILAVLAVLTFGIGFIWVIPMFYNVKGILYREVFGIETHVKATDTYSQI